MLQYKLKLFKRAYQASVVAYTYNSSTWEIETGQLPQIEASFSYILYPRLPWIM